MSIGLAFATLFFNACGEIVPRFNDTPSIKYDDIRWEFQNNVTGLGKYDSVIVILGFEDGDGDLGSFGIDSHKDIYTTIFKRVKGDTVAITYDQSLSSGQLPVLKKDKPGPIEGKMRIRLAFFPPPLSVTDSINTILYGDTLSFQIYVKDRADRTSNTIRTPEIIVLNPESAYR